MEYFCKISFNRGEIRRQVSGLIVLGYGCGSILHSLILIAPFGGGLQWAGPGPSPCAIVSHPGNDKVFTTKWCIDVKMLLSAAHLFSI